MHTEFNYTFTFIPAFLQAFRDRGLVSTYLHLLAEGISKFNKFNTGKLMDLLLNHETCLPSSYECLLSEVAMPVCNQYVLKY